MTAFYNEMAHYPAAWIRRLIEDGIIAPGDVDERRIERVRAADVAGYTQAHFFAGIGVWSYALRLVGWPDDVSVWTGSCPCQPFSQAGQREGEEDERHLWPVWLPLIGECRPPIIFGEQVASELGRSWLDNVSLDLEALGYAVGSSDLCAAGVGAPQIRQRLFWGAVRLGWVGDAEGRGPQGRPGGGSSLPWPLHLSPDASPTGGLGHSDAPGLEGSGRVRTRGDEQLSPSGSLSGRLADDDQDRLGVLQASRLHGQGSPWNNTLRRSPSGGLVDPDSDAAGKHARELSGHEGQHEERGQDGNHTPEHPSSTRGFWSHADWWLCRPERDGKPYTIRPTEPGTFPLADGTPEGVEQMRAYGNAICPWAAAAFVLSFIESLPALEVVHA